MSMTVDYSAVPEELKSLPQWVGFLASLGTNGKTTKKPVNPRTLCGASSTDPQTWGSFEQALSVVGQPCRVGQDSGTVAGIGFVFAPPYCGIDIDHCIDLETGELNPKAAEIVALMDSYTELSPSGTGLHILYKGSVHNSWKRKKADALGSGVDLEMYQQGRFFTVTGQVFGEPKAAADREHEAEAVQSRFMQSAARRVPSAAKSSGRTAADDELLNLARNSKNGILFANLYAGNWQGHYGSQSEADMAFCSLLAFWFGRDKQRMDTVFRQSGLMRDKWDRKQSGSTYGSLTLDKAIADCREVYTPPAVSSDYSITIEHSAAAPVKCYSLDDTGNAQRLTDMFKDTIRYHFTDRRWMLYDGGKWVYDQMGHIYHLIDQSIEAMEKEKALYVQMDKQNDDGKQTMEKAFEKHRKHSRSHNAKAAAEREAQHYVPISPALLDRHRDLLNTASGVIDLKDFSLRASVPQDYFTRAAAAHYDAAAQCPLWENFLREIFDNDTEMIRYIQKAVGYSLTGSTQEQCAFFLIGDGCNGKSTFLDIIRQLFGNYANNMQAESLMIRPNNNGISSDIARLKGARLVTSAEPNEGLRLNEGLLKQLTGGDVVTARKLYGDEFEFKPEFKLWMAANHKPTIRGNDFGIWRRIHIIPFVVQIPPEKMDKSLTDKLLRELDGILQWALAGLRLYQQEGLQQPSAVSAATAEYRREMNVTERFLEECTTKTFAGSVKARDLYRAYTEWCRTNGEYLMSNTKFGKEMVIRHEKVKRADGFYYSGIVLNQEYGGYSVTVV
ncbi:MAG: hypothetical protein IIZ93_06880 [Acidaminococcaceae bacterium]|nr:hypothetical protein [Acidaminococcaceae bacterium]